jgi:UDP-glucose 4-epimerase
LKASGSALQPEYHEARKVNNVQARRSSVEKAEKLIGFKARVDLESGLRELLDWHKEAKAELAAVGGSK